MIAYYHGSNFLDIRNKFIMVLLFDSGIRCSELCDLKMSDIRQTYFITPTINKYLLKYERVREQI